jgi:cell division transport system permease protein
MNAFLRGWFHIRRAPFQSLAALLVTTSGFLIISAFAFLMISFSTIISYFESRPEIIGFLKDDFEQTQVDQLVGRLRAIDGVRQVRFVSKEEALKIYRQDFSDNPLLLEMVTADILPASVEIAADNPVVLKKAADELNKSSDLFLEVVYQKDVVEKLQQLTQVVKGVGLGAAAFYALISLLVVMVVVGMNIALKRNEIEVLRLLGASGFYIYLPFLIEGVLFGLLGALIGWGVISAVAYHFAPSLAPFFGDIPFYPQSFWPFLQVLLVEGLAGILIGSISSFLAVRRHFKSDV